MVPIYLFYGTGNRAYVPVIHRVSQEKISVLEKKRQSQLFDSTHVISDFFLVSASEKNLCVNFSADQNAQRIFFIEPRNFFFYDQSTGFCENFSAELKTSIPKNYPICS